MLKHDDSTTWDTNWKWRFTIEYKDEAKEKGKVADSYYLAVITLRHSTPLPQNFVSLNGVWVCHSMEVACGEASSLFEA